MIIRTIIILLILASCQSTNSSSNVKGLDKLPDLFVVVLGTAQDGGYPQAGCDKECCKAYWEGDEPGNAVSCLAIVDRASKQYWLIDATPDLSTQLYQLQKFLPARNFQPAGVFLTHAHIGHYAGLMQMGREVMGTSSLPVWAMPRMDSFLRSNGPWSQLVSLQNIKPIQLKADSVLQLTASIKITPIRVPHRDEYSETVGYKIEGPAKRVLFIPDIDKWEKWERDIKTEISNSDLAFLDGTFYENGELPGRDMREIPHPFVSESLKLFESLPEQEKKKIKFIHFNHTNPLGKLKSPEKKAVTRKGFGLAEEDEWFEL